jgi:peptidoglycan/LPS O-acetylase OafA/YrhL
LVGGALQGRPLLAFVVELAPTLVLAELSFRLFESRFLRYKRRFSVVSRGALPRGDSLGTPRVALLVET